MRTQRPRTHVAGMTVGLRGESDGAKNVNDGLSGDEKGRERHRERRRGAPAARVPSGKFSAAEATQNIPPMPHSVAERRGERNAAPFLPMARPSLCRRSEL